MHIEPMTEAHRPAALSLLRRHVRSSMFLLGNLAEHGPTATEHLNSAHYQVVLRDAKVGAVFAPTRRGNLLVQTDREADYTDVILDACLSRGYRIEGLLADWDLVEPLWQGLQARVPAWKTTFSSREPLFERSLRQLGDAPVPPPGVVVRYLNADDYADWQALTTAFLAEEGIPEQGSAEQRRANFEDRVTRRLHWGVEVGGRLVAIAALNGVAERSGQVGGVYTAPDARRRGYARALMEQLHHDARNYHELARLVLFTGERNQAAQTLYRSIGYEEQGAFGMVFGRVEPAAV